MLSFIRIYGNVETTEMKNKAFIKPYDSQNTNTLSQETISMANDRLFH